MNITAYALSFYTVNIWLAQLKDLPYEHTAYATKLLHCEHMASATKHFYYDFTRPKRSHMAFEFVTASLQERRSYYLPLSLDLISGTCTNSTDIT